MARIAPADWTPRGVRALERKAEVAVRASYSSLIVAGPGAGKTELLAQRASYLLETGLCAAPRAILAISFKRDAAKNLRDRVARRCGPTLARRFASFTFDAFAKGVVDRFRLALPTELRPSEDYAIDFAMDHEAPLRERLVAAGTEAGVPLAKLQAVNVQRFFKSWIVGRSLSGQLDENADLTQKVVWLFWRDALHGGNKSVLNFQMLGCLAELLLRSNPLLLAALRATYSFVFLDEFQDTTGIQYRLLHTAFEGSDAVMTAVGDHKQRIMLWAGALEGVFDVFRREFAALPHELDMNYRSAPRLVQIQHHLIASLDPGSSMPTAADDGTEGEGECRLLVFPSDIVEAEYLAGKIEGWLHLDGVKASEVCILVKKLADPFSRALRSALEDRAISSRIENDFQDLMSEPVVVVVCGFLSLLCHSRDPLSWSLLSDLLLQTRGLTSDDDAARGVLSELEATLPSLRVQLEAVSEVEDMFELMYAMVDFFGSPTFCRLYPQYSQGDFLEKTIGSCSSALMDAYGRGGNWASALDDFLGVDSIPIMTIAKSKGLEFHTVIVLGLEDYAFHHPNGNPAEEECSFFVAFSRARKRVFLTFSDQRAGRWNRREKIARYYEILDASGVEIEMFD